MRQRTLLMIAIALIVVGGGGMLAGSIGATPGEPEEFERHFMGPGWMPGGEGADAGRMHEGTLGHGRWGNGGMLGPMHGGMMRGEAGTSPPATIAGARTVVITVTEFSFEPSRIEVPSGSDLNLVLDNQGDVVHDLVIASLGFHIEAEPGERAEGGLEALAPGEYAFVCSIPGHAQAGMTGLLVVG